MGEDLNCPPDPAIVRIAPPTQRPGVPQLTLLQFLTRNGIFNRQNPETRGLTVEDFAAVFDLTEVLKPTERLTIADSLPAASVGSQSVQIVGVREKVRVIRSLAYRSPAVAPDIVEVQIDAQTGAGLVRALVQTGVFPASKSIIGDVSSPLTEAMNRLLPLSLYPGDSITIKQTISPANTLESELKAWVEEYQLPLRPAGL